MIFFGGGPKKNLRETKLGRGEDQWEAWNWSCDLRANERPKKTPPDGADRQTDRQTNRQTNIATL